MEKRTLKHRAYRLPASIAALPRSYLALMGEFPLRPIKTSGDYTRATDIIHRLALREGSLDAGAEGYLEVLESLVERYDERHHSMHAGGMSPTQLLQMLVEQAGMTVSQLGILLGSKGAASELLSGKRREPSKAQITKLSARFKVDAGVFLLPASRRVRAA